MVGAVRHHVAKPNPMPESVTDRPTSAHEHVFLLTKSARYFYDADAVREALQDSTVERGYTAAELGNGGTPKSTATPTEWCGRASGGDNAYVPCWPQPAQRLDDRDASTVSADAHFATFPAQLAERCIKAGTSERGCCAACGKPWVRHSGRCSLVVEARKAAGHVGGIGGSVKLQREHQAADYDAQRAVLAGPQQYETTGWSPGCQCKVLAGNELASSGESALSPALCSIRSPAPARRCSLPTGCSAMRSA